MASPTAQQLADETKRLELLQELFKLSCDPSDSDIQDLKELMGALSPSSSSTLGTQSEQTDGAIRIPPSSITHPPDHIRPTVARRQMNSPIFYIDSFSDKMSASERNNAVFEKVHKRMEALQVRRADASRHGFAIVPSASTLQEEYETLWATHRIDKNYAKKGRADIKNFRDVETVRMAGDAYIGFPAKHVFLHLAYFRRGHGNGPLDRAEMSLSYDDKPVDYQEIVQVSSRPTQSDRRTYRLRTPGLTAYEGPGAVSPGALQEEAANNADDVMREADLAAQQAMDELLQQEEQTKEKEQRRKQKISDKQAAQRLLEDKEFERRRAEDKYREADPEARILIEEAKALAVGLTAESTKKRRQRKKK